jgi:hypothetical protein
LREVRASAFTVRNIMKAKERLREGNMEVTAELARRLEEHLREGYRIPGGNEDIYGIR